jgi:hypothetical protein
MTRTMAKEDKAVAQISADRIRGDNQDNNIDSSNNIK